MLMEELKSIETIIKNVSQGEFELCVNIKRFPPNVCLFFANKFDIFFNVVFRKNKIWTTSDRVRKDLFLWVDNEKRK